MNRVTVVLALAAALLASGPARSAANSAQELDQELHAKPDLIAGAQLFKTCAVCHGSDGTGTPDGLVPRIAGQNFSTLVKQIVDYRNEKRWDPRMEHFADKHLLSAQDLASVAAFASQIVLTNRDSIAVGSGEFLKEGAALYAHSCASCHGQSGQGSEPQHVPAIAGQNYLYLVRQIYDAVEGRRPNFPPSHIELLRPLDYTHVTGVADYLSRIPRVMGEPAPGESNGVARRPSGCVDALTCLDRSGSESSGMVASGTGGGSGSGRIVFGP